MRMLSEEASEWVYWEDMIYLEAALEALEETRALVGPVTMLVEEFDQHLAKDLAGRRRQVRAQAKCVVGDFALDEDVEDLNVDLVAEVRHDRNDPAYKAVFVESYSASTRYALERQIKVNEGFVERLQLAVVPSTIREEHTPRLQEGVEQGKALLGERRQALMAQTQNQMDMQDWKTNCNAVRRAVFGQLTTLAAQTKRGGEWADLFFRPAARPASKPTA